ncbi:hypothetical protein [Erythrobacter rubeus]|uniref:PRC-barrel domain-containing protein n=1 Tax=Erythrobacter rubeus TaxID=2760803 RepID=A0ABR8KPU2_9SPHN|nr:hypothetical protein [Erythrobacter rubeus]MBD2842680.1 hypothetical protein [Erythrobacter rubeus]
MIKSTIELLGLRATDRVSGLEGVIDSVCFDLYGCVQVSLAPKAKDGEVPNGRWLDVNRVEVSEDRVMPAPDFDGKGKTPDTYDQGPAMKAPR